MQKLPVKKSSIQYAEKTNHQLQKDAQIRQIISQNVDEDEKWITTRKLDERLVYADSIKNIFGLDYLSKSSALKINHPLFKIPQSYKIIHMPRLKDREYKSWAFSFGSTTTEIEKNRGEMFNAEKYLLGYFSHSFTKNSREYQIWRFYAIAPKLEPTDLPILYSIEILKSTNNQNFYGIRGSAVVYGAVDGICQLFQINTSTKNSATIFEFKSEKTNFKIFPDNEQSLTNINFTNIKEIPNILDINDAINFAFKKFNIIGRVERYPNNNTKIVNLAQQIIINPQLTKKITPSTLLSKILAQKPSNNTTNSKQFVYDKNGKQQKTTIQKRSF